MKCISFNINSIRARLHQLEALIEKHNPDFIGLQETKVVDAEFPLKAVEAMGYHAHFHGQKSHYGVAILSKTAPLKVQKGFPTDDAKAQRRMISATFHVPNLGDIELINGYFPQGESRDHEVKFPAKKKFYEDLQQFLDDRFQTSQNVVLMGDFNIAPSEKDIGIGSQNAKRWLRTGKCSFLPEERAWMSRLMDWGFHDTFRHLHPDIEDRFSWFDYRSRGFDAEPKRGLRIDMIMSNANLTAQCREAGIDYELRGIEKPSDHCPIWSTFEK